MKNAFLSTLKSATDSWRLAVIIGVVATVLAGGRAFGAPVVKTLGGGASKTFFGPAMYPYTNSLYATYHTPLGLAVDDANENLYVADENNNAVRMLDLVGGFTYTVITNINQPVAVALDSDYNLYVLTRGTGSAVSTNGMILEYDWFFDLIGTNVTHLTNATAMAMDSEGNLYVTARTNLLLQISSNAVNTIATVPGSNVLLEGLAIMPNGNIAVCDYGNNGIYSINMSTNGWLITTNSGFNGAGDGTGVANRGLPVSEAKFFHPFGVAASGDGSLIVSDSGNNRVKVVTASGIVTNLFGVSSNYWNASFFPGWADGTVAVPDQPKGVASRVPAGLVLSADGSTVYDTEDFYHLVRMITGGSFAQMPAPPPVAPTGVTATLVTNENFVEVLLTWNSSVDATNYIVERSTSTNAFSFLANVGLTNQYIDATAIAGQSYYYAIIAEDFSGESQLSTPASVSMPVAPPPGPTIGWFNYQLNDNNQFVSVFHPLINTNTFENDVDFAISNNIPDSLTPPTFLSGVPPLTNNVLNGPSAPPYADGTIYPGVVPLSVTIEPSFEIEAENKNGGGVSPIVSTWVNFVCGNVQLGEGATNAAQFTVDDITTNVTYYYTTDGTSPLTNTPASQIVASTNGLPVTLSIDIASNFTFEVVAEKPGYSPSAVWTNYFLAQNFHGNEMTWGFASGEASSEFIASPGQIFYAPVTITALPGAGAYAMQFNMIVTNLGPDPVPSGDFGFQSFMKQPGVLSNTLGTVLFPIPPLMFVGSSIINPPPPGVLTGNPPFATTNFLNMLAADTNLNELAVGWFEVYDKTNLYNAGSQNLWSLTQDYITVYPNANFPNDIIVGGYAFQVPTNAQPGEQYEISLNRPSANGDGLGGDGSAVPITLVTSGSLYGGPINSLKIVTIGQPKYLVGDVYPFRWFNAGDFGNGDLITYGANDVENVFRYAVYGLNFPLGDLYDAMDSAGGFGAYDADAGYWTNANVTLNTAQKNALFNVNDDTTINAMAFGDGQIDICDVYTTFVRSEFGDTYWFQRFYTNDPVHGVFGRVAQAITTQTNVDSFASSSSKTASPSSILKELATVKPIATSITNTPLVHFAAGDYLASAGQTIQIPVTATVYGTAAMRMLLMNAYVMPLDGSPPITQPITFTPNGPFANSSIYNPPSASSGTEDSTTNNLAVAFLPDTWPISTGAAVTGSNVVGYLNITIPANATTSSAYAINFNKASASPNGLISFPKTTYTGLITLSSRNTSYYNDGIPDSWRLRYFGTIYNQLSVSNADADGTGMNNWQKYQAGLNPVDPTSVLDEGIDQGAAQGPKDFVLYWPSVIGKQYVIERSPTLFPPKWTAISTNIGDGTYMEIHDNAGDGGGYYQVTTQ